MQLLRVDAEGAVLGDERAVMDLIGDAFAERAEWVVVPVERLGPEFFRLRSGVAGAVVQKFANYRLGLAVVGDISRYVAASEALRDFVRESNRGRQLWFVPDEAALEERLGEFIR
ncbi:DUF4180 domain-containing protein [Cryptosporangium aurantiacum]|uniref:DUF4180 domain-containing protein n=1 Tax=Cryptosporangium aurantiacum TaxID=134849 RepID=A0A1M7RBP3_9ACTN|nr:DUF4180 domain-containing protein [Cryptosporangium aurantiacum]SHN43559.1 protein of unknown function [Cryptosporangium aurantiacum]